MKSVLIMLSMIKRKQKNSIIHLNSVEIEKLTDMMMGIGRNLRDMKWNGMNKIKGKVPNSIKTYH